MANVEIKDLTNASLMRSAMAVSFFSLNCRGVGELGV